MMTQSVLPFKYETTTKTKLTALAGLPTFLELAAVLGVVGSVEKHVKVRLGSQGWTDVEHIIGLMMLNLAGGEHVEDLDRLEADEGLCEVMLQLRSHGLSRKQRRKLKHRWRKGRERAFASRSATHRYLKEFHDPAEEERRKVELEKGNKAFIPSPNRHLLGMAQVNAGVVAQMQKHNSVATATLDQDATLNLCNKEEALHSYKGPKAYQPFNTWWAEQMLMLHTEFRDGNVPAGYEQLRCFKESLEFLPEGVEKVFLRSDTAGYQHDLMRYCAEGGSERFGVVEFTISCDVTKEFKAAVTGVNESSWCPSVYRNPRPCAGLRPS